MRNGTYVALTAATIFTDSSISKSVLRHRPSFCAVSVSQIAHPITRPLSCVPPLPKNTSIIDHHCRIDDSLKPAISRASLFVGKKRTDMHPIEPLHDQVWPIALREIGQHEELLIEGKRGQTGIDDPKISIRHQLAELPAKYVAKALIFLHAPAESEGIAYKEHCQSVAS